MTQFISGALLIDLERCSNETTESLFSNFQLYLRPTSLSTTAKLLPKTAHLKELKYSPTKPPAKGIWADREKTLWLTYVYGQKPSHFQISRSKRGLKAHFPGSSLTQSPTVNNDLSNSPSPTQPPSKIPYLVLREGTSNPSSDDVTYSPKINVDLPTESSKRSFRQPAHSLSPPVAWISTGIIPVALKTIVSPI